MKTPLEDLIDATMQEHERRLRLRERDILDCLYERQREVWVLTAIGGLNAATIAARINAREGAGTITEGAVQIAAGGMGIDLTAARYGVYYSLGFSYGEYMQSRARLRRPGQERTVFFYQLLATCDGETVDHDVMAAIGRKEETVEGVLERMRGRQR